jgi:hypothetical protein
MLTHFDLGGRLYFDGVPKSSTIKASLSFGISSLALGMQLFEKLALNQNNQTFPPSQPLRSRYATQRRLGRDGRLPAIAGAELFLGDDLLEQLDFVRVLVGVCCL